MFCSQCSDIMALSRTNFNCDYLGLNSAALHSLTFVTPSYEQEQGIFTYPPHFPNSGIMTAAKQTHWQQFTSQ